MAIRILIADDHRILREGLAAIFDAEPDLTVIGEAEDGFGAVEGARALNPDVIILDLSMPRMDGLSAIKKIKRVAPQTRILVMTFHKTETHVFEAMREGADGYVLKDTGAAELLIAVRSVGAGRRYLCSAVADQFVTAALGGGKQETAAPKLERLSAREREVMKLVAEGHTSKEVAKLLCISEKTVEKHRGSMMRKLELSGVPALTAFAIEHGVLTPQ